MALSSCESEFYAIVSGAIEAIFVRTLLAECGINDAKIEVLTDSTSAQQLCARTGLGRIKHLNIRLLWIQDKIKSGEISIGRVPTQDNLADILTKYLGVRQFKAMTQNLGIDRVTFL